MEGRFVFNGADWRVEWNPQWQQAETHSRVDLGAHQAESGLASLNKDIQVTIIPATVSASQHDPPRTAPHQAQAAPGSGYDVGPRVAQGLRPGLPVPVVQATGYPDGRGTTQRLRIVDTVRRAPVYPSVAPVEHGTRPAIAYVSQATGYGRQGQQAVSLLRNNQGPGITAAAATATAIPQSGWSSVVPPGWVSICPEPEKCPASYAGGPVAGPSRQPAAGPSRQLVAGPSGQHIVSIGHQPVCGHSASAGAGAPQVRSCVQNRPPTGSTGGQPVRLLAPGGPAGEGGESDVHRNIPAHPSFSENRPLQGADWPTAPCPLKSIPVRRLTPEQETKIKAKLKSIERGEIFQLAGGAGRVKDFGEAHDLLSYADMFRLRQADRSLYVDRPFALNVLGYVFGTTSLPTSALTSRVRFPNLPLAELYVLLRIGFIRVRVGSAGGPDSEIERRKMLLQQFARFDLHRPPAWAGWPVIEWPSHWTDEEVAQMRRHYAGPVRIAQDLGCMGL